MAEAEIYLLLPRKHWPSDWGKLGGREGGEGVFSLGGLWGQNRPIVHYLDNLGITSLQEEQIRKALPRKPFLSVQIERKTPYSETTDHYPPWKAGRGQLLAVISRIHLFKQCNQLLWIANVCLKAGPGDEHALPFDKGKRGSRRQAGLCHTAGPFQRLQGDRVEALGCFHCEGEEENRCDKVDDFHMALGCSDRQRKRAGTRS